MPDQVARTPESNATLVSNATGAVVRPVIRYTLLVTFCFVSFLDAYNNSAVVTAIPPISADLRITNSRAIWLLSAYQLTFAALLLIVCLLRSNL